MASGGVARSRRVEGFFFLAGSWPDPQDPKASGCVGEEDNEAQELWQEGKGAVVKVVVVQSRLILILLTLDLLGGLVAAVKDGSLPLEIEETAAQVC